MLLHLGHLGSSSDSITYIRHLGHPTRTMDVVVASLLLPVSTSISDDTHELGGDVGDSVADRLGDSTLGLSLGGDRFSFNSSLGPFLRLIFVMFMYIKWTWIKHACNITNKNKRVNSTTIELFSKKDWILWVTLKVKEGWANGLKSSPLLLWKNQQNREREGDGWWGVWRRKTKIYKGEMKWEKMDFILKL